MNSTSIRFVVCKVRHLARQQKKRRECNECYIRTDVESTTGVATCPRDALPCFGPNVQQKGYILHAEREETDQRTVLSARLLAQFRRRLWSRRRRHAWSGERKKWNRSHQIVFLMIKRYRGHPNRIWSMLHVLMGWWRVNCGEFHQLSFQHCRRGGSDEGRFAPA